MATRKRSTAASTDTPAEETARPKRSTRKSAPAAKKTTAKKSTSAAKKPATKKAAAKKPAASKETTATKAAPKKAAAKKPAAPKKAAAKKPAAPKKAAAKKPAAPKKAAAKKPAAPKKAAAKKPAAPKKASAPPAETPASMRVHAVAKELGVASKDLLAAIAASDLDLAPKTASSSVPGEHLEAVRALFGAPAEEKAPAKKKTSRRKKSPAAAAETKAAEPPAETSDNKAAAKADDRPKREPRPKPPKRDAAEVEAAGRDFITSLLDSMGVAARARASFDGRRLQIELSGPQTLGLFGKLHAGASTEMIDALQLLTGKAVFGDFSRDYHVRVDAEHFRDKRVDNLKSAGKRLEAFIRSSGMHVRLPVMNSFDRYAIHKVIGRARGLYSESAGEGVFRALSVGPRPPRREQPSEDGAEE